MADRGRPRPGWPPGSATASSSKPQEMQIARLFHLIHVDDLTDSNALQFVSLLDLANLTQHVSFPTHRLSHTLDLVITATDSILCPVVSQCPISPSDQSYPLHSEYCTTTLATCVQSPNASNSFYQYW
jgi:hypothetical protein